MRYEEIKSGDEIPQLVRKVNIVQTAMYCGVTWDFARIHYDSAFAKSAGFREAVVDPQMFGAFCARMLTDWVSPEGGLKKLSLRYRGACFLGDTLTYKGKVANKYVKDNEELIDCEIVVENQKAERLVEAAAVISFSQ